MKQDIKIGNVVDDGNGDYLRRGGQKINDNFTDLYYELGDGEVPYAAGAWKTYHASTGADLTADWGKSYAIDTSTGQVALHLPKGSVNDYNKVIRARDVFSTWNTNSVTLIPALGDTIKGNAAPVEITTQFADLELVYCSPGRWEYIPNKQINRITSSDINNVARVDFVVDVEGQTDFLDVFNGIQYNISNTQVFHRGNILYYGDVFSDNSDYGSPGALPGEIVELNGVDLRLKQKSNIGDVVTVITYMDGVSQWRSSYMRRQITLLDSSRTSIASNPGSVFVADLSTLNTIPFSALGVINSNPVNPNSLEVLFNGIIQVQAGQAGTPVFRCEGAEADSSIDCQALGGTWIESMTDYIVNLNDDNGIPESLSFDRKMEHGDIITITWFNNDLGTLLELDDILDQTDERYILQGGNISITGDIRYTSFDKPQVPNIETVATTQVEVNSPYVLFNLIYPVGTIYENASNPNNPATYMGFGSWKLWGQGLTTVGWNNDETDPNFALNNNDLDSGGLPSHTAGGTTGTTTIEITNPNLPVTQTDEKVLIADDNGPITVGGCQIDPDDVGPVYTKYREDFAVTNATHTPPTPVNNIQPSITVYRWLRIA